MKHKSTSGTSHLRDHLIHCIANTKNQKLKQVPVTSYFKSTQALSASDDKKLKETCVQFIAQDIRPFKAIEDQGFLNIAKLLVQLGAKYGNFDVKKALLSRHSLKRHAVKQADEVQKSIIAEMLSSIKHNGYVGITTDMWINDNNISFLSITLHYEKEACLHNYAVNHFVDDYLQ